MAEQKPAREYPLLYEYGEKVAVNGYIHHKGKGETAVSNGISARVTDWVPINRGLDEAISVNLYIQTSRASSKQGIAKGGNDLQAIAGGTIQVCYKTTLRNIHDAEDKRKKMRQMHGLPFEE